MKPIDPCADTSPLQVDPKVKEACEAMAETGDEDGDYLCVTPATFEEYSLCVPDTYDNNTWWLTRMTDDLPNASVDHRDCVPAAEYQAWATPNKGETQPDYVCANPGWSFSSADGKALALEEMPKNVLGYIRSMPLNGWTDASMSTAAVLPGNYSVHCPKGALCVRAKDDCFCKCSSDVDCTAMGQAEAVCELGMCFYVDEPAAPSPLPPGPPAYGFDDWSEILTVDGDAITFTPAGFASLVPGALRDNQDFDALGTITRCGRGSLCDYLGLQVGDTAVADEDAVDELLAGEVVDVVVMDATGGTRMIAVSIDFGE